MTPAPRSSQLPDAATPQRAWARDHLVDLMNLLLPSFMPDGRSLDEEAIRHDVRHAMAQGFSATLPMVNWTLPDDPRWEELHRIVIDEAQGRLGVHGIVFGSQPDRDRDIARRLERLGVDLILMAATHEPDISADDLHLGLKQRIEATDLPVMLYAATGKRRAFPHLGPSGQPLDIYDRLADLGNVVAVKVSQPMSLTSTMQIFDRLGDRLSIGPVNLDFAPLLARSYEVRWSGQWNAEAVQTPDLQLGNRLLQACAARDFVRADAIARQLQPVLDLFFATQAPVIKAGSHPWQHSRYYSWLGGGNGGVLPPDPHAAPGVLPQLDAASRAAIRAAFASSGLALADETDATFEKGRAGSARP
jgi:4-hydroxy-tetrahydrodipicolinate synthase